MDWLSYLMALVVYGGYYEYSKTSQVHPLAPWDKVGSGAYVIVENESHDSIPVYALAPEVDAAKRFMGWARHCRETDFRLPYADAKVQVLYGDSSVVLKVRQPSVWKVRYP